MTRLIATLLASAVLATACPTGRANVIHVPQDHLTIQAGIDAANSFDTVLVAEGVYVENVLIRFKNVYLASRYMLDGDTARILATVIDGSQPAHADSASAVRIIGASGTVIQGFTITGGTGTNWIDLSDGLTYCEGGGILVEHGSVQIRNNIIIGNQAINDGSGNRSAGGGGIRCGYGTTEILNNVLADNEGLYGGGIVAFHNPVTVRNNVFYRNSGGQDYGGGGLWIASTVEGTSFVENNTFAENVSALDGGGVVLWNNTVHLQGNIFWGNLAKSYPQIGMRSGTSASTVSYSDVEGGFVGANNIDAAPLFEAHNCVLTDASPCVDAGDPNIFQNDPNDPGNPGFALYPAQGARRNDMGAYGGPDIAAFPTFDAPGFRLDVDSVDFDTVAVDSSRSVVVRIAKDGFGVVRVDSVRFAGGFAADLTLSSGLPVSLGPLSSDSLDSLILTWSPSTYGVLMDTVLVYHDEPHVTSPQRVRLTGRAPGMTGDPNMDGSITASDIIYMVNHVFKSGPGPLPVAAAGDVNCDGSITASDVIYLVGHVFKGGPAPCN